jgi:hypothetical protein
VHGSPHWTSPSKGAGCGRGVPTVTFDAPADGACRTAMQLTMKNSAGTRVRRLFCSRHLLTCLIMAHLYDMTTIVVGVKSLRMVL